MLLEHLLRVVVGAHQICQGFHVDTPLVLDEDVRAVRHQSPRRVDVIAANRLVERRFTVRVLRVHVRTGIDQHLHHFEGGFMRRLVQRRCQVARAPARVWIYGFRLE